MYLFFYHQIYIKCKRSVVLRADRSRAVRLWVGRRRSFCSEKFLGVGWFFLVGFSLRVSPLPPGADGCVGRSCGRWQRWAPARRPRDREETSVKERWERWRRTPTPESDCVRGIDILGLGVGGMEQRGWCRLRRRSRTSNLSLPHIRNPPFWVNL